MIFIKDGKEINTPYLIKVEGIEIELTYLQLQKLGYKTLAEIVNDQNRELNSDVNINETKNTILSNIDIIAPEGSDISGDIINLPFKLGYKWVPSLVNGRIIYESVADPNSIGTENNPLYYAVGTKLIPNAFYIISGLKYVYMGALDVVEFIGFGMDDMVLWEETKTEEQPSINKVDANTEDNPYEFVPGVEVVPNCYYSYGGAIYVYTGKRKVAENFESVLEDMVVW